MHFRLKTWMDGHASNHHGIQILCFVPGSIHPLYIFQSSFYLHGMETVSQYCAHVNPVNPVTTSTSKLWKFSYKEVLFTSYQRVSRRYGLTYSPKVQSICIITYNLFTRLVGIVPNECLVCFMMAVKDDRRSTNNIVFEQLVDVLILVVK